MGPSPYEDRYSSPIWLELDRIDPNPAATIRAAISPEAIEDYERTFDDLPPVKVIADRRDRHWLADGYHRLLVARKLGRTSIPCRVRPGTYLDAFREAAHANRGHGVRETNADRRHRVEEALRDPELEGKSNVWIADLCCVTEHLVRRIRKGDVTFDNVEGDMVSSPDGHDPEEPPPGETRVGQDGKCYRVDARSTAQKRRDVAATIRDHSDWNNARVAEHCRVHRQLVSKVRKSLAVAEDSDPAAPDPSTGSHGVETGDDHQSEERSEVAAAHPEPDGSEEEGHEFPSGDPAPAPDDPADPDGLDWNAQWHREERLIMARFQAWAEEARPLFVMGLRSLAGILAVQCPTLVDRSGETFF